MVGLLAVSVGLLRCLVMLDSVFDLLCVSLLCVDVDYWYDGWGFSLGCELGSETRCAAAPFFSFLFVLASLNCWGCGLIFGFGTWLLIWY